MSHFWSKRHCNLEFIKKKLRHGEIVHNFIFKINEAYRFWVLMYSELDVACLPGICIWGPELNWEALYSGGEHSKRMSGLAIKNPSFTIYPKATPRSSGQEIE